MLCRFLLKWPKVPVCRSSCTGYIVFLWLARGGLLIPMIMFKSLLLPSMPEWSYFDSIYSTELIGDGLVTPAERSFFRKSVIIFLLTVYSFADYRPIVGSYLT